MFLQFDFFYLELILYINLRIIIITYLLWNNLNFQETIYQ